MWLAFQKQRKREPGLPLSLLTLTFIACTAPWIIRNDVVLGKPAFIRDNFWVEFHLGNYHLSNAMGWGGKHPTGNIIELNLFRNLGELGTSSIFALRVSTSCANIPESFSN